MLSLPPGSLYSHTFSGTFFPPPSFPLCLAFFSPRNGRRWILRGHTSTNDTTSATAITSSSSLAVVSPSFSPSSHCADGRRRRRRPKEEGRRRRKEGRRRLLLSPPPQEVLEKQRGGGGGAAASAVIGAVWKEEPFSLSPSFPKRPPSLFPRLASLNVACYGGGGGVPTKKGAVESWGERTRGKGKREGVSLLSQQLLRRRHHSSREKVGEWGPPTAAQPTTNPHPFPTTQTSRRRSIPLTHPTHPTHPMHPPSPFCSQMPPPLGSQERRREEGRMP